jgi:hypothetical protein
MPFQAELSAIPYPDVRQKQLDTVLHILHASGETLNHGWPLILTMIGSLESDHSDILVRFDKFFSLYFSGMLLYDNE